MKYKGWDIEQVLFEGKKPVAWIAQNRWEIHYFVTCPVCKSTNKNCKFCKRRE
jgi:hypothetical protein